MDIPAIVAEFVSKWKRDRVRDYEKKKREYQVLGVQEYWGIDRFDRTMTVFKNIPGEPAEVIVKAEETYRTARPTRLRAAAGPAVESRRRLGQGGLSPQEAGESQEPKGVNAPASSSQSHGVAQDAFQDEP